MNCCLGGAVACAGGAQKRAGGVASAKYSKIKKLLNLGKVATKYIVTVHIILI